MKVLNFSTAQTNQTELIKVSVYHGFNTYTGVILLENTERDVAALAFAEQVADNYNLEWYDFDCTDI